jgi:hypothetical protein
MQGEGFSTDFIVRIYRRSGKKRRPFVGVVERVGVEGKMAFTTYDELWEILIDPAGNHQKGGENALKDAPGPV